MACTSNTLGCKFGKETMILADKNLAVHMLGVCIFLTVPLLTISCEAQSKGRVMSTKNSSISDATPDQAKPISKITFSSAYTKLNSKTCEPIGKPENEQDEPSEICTGYKGYNIYVSNHGIARFYIGREISKDNDSWTELNLPSFLLNAGSDQIIEWRLANGEPFACIVRAEYDKRLFNPDEGGMANNLIVQNLRGFATISVSIDARKNKRANQEARERADAAYRKL